MRESRPDLTFGNLGFSKVPSSRATVLQQHYMSVAASHLRREAEQIP